MFCDVDPATLFDIGNKTTATNKEKLITQSSGISYFNYFLINTNYYKHMCYNLQPNYYLIKLITLWPLIPLFIIRPIIQLHVIEFVALFLYTRTFCALLCRVRRDSTTSEPDSPPPFIHQTVTDSAANQFAILHVIGTYDTHACIMCSCVWV